MPTAHEKSNGQAITLRSANRLRASASPVSVVDETTTSQSGCRSRNAGTRVPSRFTSPTLTAWNHATGLRPGFGTLTRPRSFAARLVRYRPVARARQRSHGDRINRASR